MTLLSREINQVSPSSLPTLVENAFRSSNFDGVMQQASNVFSQIPSMSSMSTMAAMAAMPALPSLPSTPAVPQAPTMSLVPFSPVVSFSLPTTVIWFAPSATVSAALSMRTQPETLRQPTVTHTVQSIQIPLPCNSASSASHQPSTSSGTVHAQMAADQKLLIGLMSLKLPLPSFCPLTHSPREWLENFDMYCKNASKAYNLPLEKLITDNLYSLFPKTEKSWLVVILFVGKLSNNSC